jgi:hypothetical protein
MDAHRGTTVVTGHPYGSVKLAMSRGAARSTPKS